MIDDLSTALEVEAARAGSTTGEATSVLEAVPPAERKLSGRRPLVLAGDRRCCCPRRRRGAAGGAADQQRQRPRRRRRRAEGQGQARCRSPKPPTTTPRATAKRTRKTVSFAVDGNPTGTAWSSEHYDTDTFAGTKTGPDPGVGLYVTAEVDRARPAAMIIRTPTPGWDAEIFATASGPPEELSEWGEPVGEVTDAQELEEVELHLGSPAKYFLIWFNKAAPARDQEGRYQVEISDVKLID